MHSLLPTGLGDRDAECDSEGRLKTSKSIFSRNRVEPAASPVVVRNGSLRQRGGVAAPVEIEESLLQPDQDAPVRGDSMSLFATLVPPPLRKSKKNFTSGEPDHFCGSISCLPAKKGVPRNTFLPSVFDSTNRGATLTSFYDALPCLLRVKSCGVRRGSVKSCTSHSVSAEGVGRRERTTSDGASMKTSSAKCI